MKTREWTLVTVVWLAGPTGLAQPQPAAVAPAGAAGQVAAALDAALFEYLDGRYGAVRTGTLRDAARPAEFSARLRELTGKDILQLGEEMMAEAERKSRVTGAPGAAVPPAAAGPFALYATAGSPAARDLGLIGASMESAFRRVAAALQLDGAIAAARRRMLNDGQIDVILHASRQGDSATAIGPGGFGATSLGATIRDGRAVLTVRIHVLYLNALSLAVAEHEAAHAAVLLGVFDTATFERREPRDGDALKSAFFASYPAIPTFIQEGIGDWAVYAGGLYEAWGIFLPVETLVRELRDAGRTLPIADLVAGDVRFRARHHKVYSLQAASFLGCLFGQFGHDKVRAWLLAGDTNGVRSFARVFGRSLAEVEAGTCGTPAPPGRVTQWSSGMR